MTVTNGERATFGAGCFWCTEALFKNVKGVLRVTSGYAGGTVDRPSYEQVCSGKTGHAEVTHIEFDPTVISFAQLVELFFLTHDPTQLNRQGNDIGAQYRSVIFGHSAGQRATALSVKERLVGEMVFAKPIVTEILPFTNFFPAEEYHQNYYAKNPTAAYCQVIISPKLAKFRATFSNLLKT